MQFPQQPPLPLRAAILRHSPVRRGCRPVLVRFAIALGSTIVDPGRPGPSQRLILPSALQNYPRRPVLQPFVRVNTWCRQESTEGISSKRCLPGRAVAISVAEFASEIRAVGITAVEVCTLHIKLQFCSNPNHFDDRAFQVA